jgi:hypothetical protein
VTVLLNVLAFRLVTPIVINTKSRGSTVGTETDSGLGVRVPIESKIVSSAYRPGLWGTPILLSNGYSMLFSRVIAAGRKADH